MFIVLLILLLVIVYIKFNPYLDIFKDYRGIRHYILWYDWNGERKNIHLFESGDN